MQRELASAVRLEDTFRKPPQLVAGVDIAFLGDDISGLEPDKICKRGISMIFQLVKPFLRMTVFDNLIAGALLRTNSVQKATR